MKDKTYEIFILNPKSSMISQIRRKIVQCEFEEVKSAEMNHVWKYKKENKSIDLALCEDSIGPYIVMVCAGISNDCLREHMSVCPECGTGNLQISILFCWRNPITEQLFTEGKVKYGPGAYDRHGTRPETHRCLNCGCKWHNSASMFYWNEIIQHGGVLTKTELGLI